MAIPSLAAGLPSRAGRIIKRARRELLEFSFFVDHVLPSNWIILLELKFVGGIRPVFRGCVEVTGPRRGFKLDLFPLALCHGCLLSIRRDSLLSERAFKSMSGQSGPTDLQPTAGSGTS